MNAHLLYSLILFTAIICGVVTCEARQQDIHLAGELQTRGTIAAFSQDTLTVTFHYIHPQAAGQQLTADFYQFGGPLAAPLRVNVEPERIAENDAVGEFSFAINLPEVTRKARFLLHVKAKQPGAFSWHNAGSALVVVYPLLDWDELRERAGDTEIRTKAEGPVTRFLREKGWDIRPAKAGDPHKPKGLLLWEDDFTADPPPDSAAPGQEILIFRELEPGFDFRFAGTAGIVEIIMELPDKITGDPAAEIRLYEIIKAALGRKDPAEPAQS